MRTRKVYQTFGGTTKHFFITINLSPAHIWEIQEHLSLTNILWLEAGRGNTHLTLSYMNLAQDLSSTTNN